MEKRKLVTYLLHLIALDAVGDAPQVVREADIHEAGAVLLRERGERPECQAYHHMTTFGSGSDNFRLEIPKYHELLSG